MFKTLSVSIGKTPFIIEEQAYTKLDQYLQAIRAHFASTPDADEIVSDIESRMAEELTEALGKNRKIIEKKDIDAVIATMGTVEDFRKFDEGQSREDASEQFSFKKIRLYRDADNQVIGGVAAGIANYFNIDPIIIRLAFGLSLFLGGFGAVLYIVLWVALPEARTTAEKVEMTGGRVTLSAIQQRIDEALPPAARKGVLRKIVAFPFQVIRVVLQFLGRVLKVLIPLVGRIAGTFITIAAASAIAGLTFVLFAILLNPNSPYVGLPLHDAVSTSVYVTLLLCGYFIAFIPVLLVLLVGASFISLRNLFSVSSIIALTVLWFGAATIGATTFFSVAPQLEPIFAQYDERTEQSFELEDFTGVSANGIQQIVVTQGPEFSVTLEGTQRAQATHKPIVENGIVSLQTLPDNNDRCVIFCLSRKSTLHVTMPSLDSVVAEDGSYIRLESFSGSSMTIATQDIAYVEADVSLSAIAVNTHDNSSVDLRGSANTITAITKDISRIRGEHFTVQDATIMLADVSRVILDVRQSLKGSASDVSRMQYISTPITVEFETLDVASVQRRDYE